MAEPSKTQDVEEAAEAAQQLADAAEVAASTATENAEVAVAAAGQAQSIADGLFNYAEMLSSPSEFVYLLGIFILAIFVGYYVVWSVTPALHTPLMSVTNAVSSVVIVGALIAVGANLVDTNAFWPKTFGFLAVMLASVNIVGGFMVTQRMLEMYKKKER